MQGERASLGSLSETLNFEHGSTSSSAVIDQQIHWENIHNLGDNELPGYIISSADTDTTFANSVYHEQHDLQRFSLGEGSSSGTKYEAASHSEQWMEIGRFEEPRNDKIELNPFLVQSPSGNRVVRNVNLNAEHSEHHEDMNLITGHRGLFEVNGLRPGLLPENSARAGSSVDGRRAYCKRKALDSSIGQSSSSGGFREFQRGESSSWVQAPAFYSPDNDLNISLDHEPRGLVSGTVPNLSAPGRVNPTDQQETVSPTVYSAGSAIRQPVAPSLNSAGPLPIDQHSIDLGYGHGLGNFTSQNPNASATRMPPISGNMIPSFQWIESPVAMSGSSSSAGLPVDRNVIHRDETRQRSNILENPLFVAPLELRNLAHSHINRNASGDGHVALPSSRTSVRPSALSPTWIPYQNRLPHNQRRLSEHLRRSLLSSLPTNQRSARSLVPPATQDEHVLQSSGDNTSQGHNQAYSRAGPRQGQNAVGIHSLQSLESTSRGRSRLTASEIRNVLDHMRRAGTLRLEDVMLLNQSMVLGVADIHDRYRDMRLDVDSMTYEELLSLEERIGDVCTGLNEETISNCLKEKKYKSSTRSPQEVEPCCICQEEYKEGEEMGMLECGHDFHGHCIKEWLKRKNLCPICKTTGLNATEKPKRL